MQALASRFLRSPVLINLPVPKPQADELLIKVSYVALNPTDYKHASMALPPSKIVGCEFAGVVSEVGAQLQHGDVFAVGDRIAGAVHGCRHTHTGGFAEYLLADPALCFHVPSRIPLEKACTLTVGWVSSMHALRLRLYKDAVEPSGKDDTLLVYSAATNMGLHLVQQARLEHPDLFIIALASSRHHARLLKLGATMVFDYGTPSVVDEVRALRRDIRRGVDCHSEGLSTSIAAQCMVPTTEINARGQEKTRRIIRTLPPSLMKGTLPDSVRADEWIVAYTSLGKPFWFLFKHYPTVPEDYKSATLYLRRLSGLLKDGKVVPMEHRLLPGGLEGILDGFSQMKAGLVRGEKLVCMVSKDHV